MQTRLNLLPRKDPPPDRPPAPMTGPVTRLMTANEVSDMLRVPRSTVYELTRTRRIPYLKVGRRTLFEPHELSRWIAEQNVPPR